MKTLALVCIGGAVGSGLRYAATHAVTQWALRVHGSAFPWGTLAVNVLGSFLLGFLLTARAASGGVPEDLRFAVGTGVLGGFTTYSTFNFETLALAQGGRLGAAAANVGVTLLACIGAGLAGMLLARAVAP